MESGWDRPRFRGVVELLALGKVWVRVIRGRGRVVRVRVRVRFALLYLVVRLGGEMHACMHPCQVDSKTRGSFRLRARPRLCSECGLRHRQ